MATVVNSVKMILDSSSTLIGLIAPSSIDIFLSGITKSMSILYFTPSPLQSSHEPYGALKENILGSNSSRE